MEFKCRVCGWNSYSMLFGPFDGEAYKCDNCLTVFIDPEKFSLNREIRIKYLDNYDLKNWGEIDYKHLYDSGADLRAAIDKPVTIYPLVDCKWNEDYFVKVPFGIKVEFSHNDMDLKIYNRSGLASKNGISIRNKVGVIDNLYRGECMGFFQNEGRVPYTINPGDRVAQLVVEKRLDVNIVTIDELSDTDRGDRGFGSTGKN